MSGNFTVEDVQQLAVLFRAGAMPAKLTVMEEWIVPSDPLALSRGWRRG